MEAWRDFLLGQGKAVALVALAGHEPALRPAWRDVSAARWLEDVERAARGARERWPRAGLSLCGYSLGAVAGMVWSLERGQSWRRAIFLSPAFRVHRLFVPLLIAARGLPGRWRIPSLAPRSYRAHAATSLSAFSALRELSDRFQKLVSEPLRQAVRAPSRRELAIFAQGDELISTAYLERYKRLVNPGLELFPLRLPSPRRYPRHLIIDPRSLGADEWGRMTAHVARWLREETPRREG
jgi:alpha-beta hydrolase superfamily lysophospholipase